MRRRGELAQLQALDFSYLTTKHAPSTWALGVTGNLTSLAANPGAIIALSVRTLAISGGSLTMPRWNLAWLLGISGVALLGYAVSHSAPPRAKDQDYELVRLVVDAMDEVDHKYVRSLDPEAKRKLIEDMINGGLEHLDPHSGFINSRG